jgi:hypothetical protein
MPSKHDQWAARLRRFEQSAATVADFCDREGVSTASFYLWRKRFRDQDAPRFVPVTLAPPRPAPPVEVAFPSGVVIRLPAGAAALADLFALARGESC